MGALVYDGEDSDTPGRVLRNITMHVPELPDYLRGLGDKVFEIKEFKADMDDWYFHKGVLTPRPTMPILLSKTQIKADGKDETKLAGIPKDAQVYWGGQLIPDLNETELVVASDVPATYRIEIMKWPYKMWFVDIKAI